MSKKIESQFEKDCPICGGKIWGRGEKVLIEGAKITVCQSCAQYGIKIKSKPIRTDISKALYPKSKSTVKKVVHRKEIEENVEDDAHSVFIGDADNDGDNDIVTANYYDDTVSILKWNVMNNDWDPQITKNVRRYPMSVFVEDADNDGDI